MGKDKKKKAKTKGTYERLEDIRGWAAWVKNPKSPLGEDGISENSFLELKIDPQTRIGTTSSGYILDVALPQDSPPLFRVRDVVTFLPNGNTEFAEFVVTYVTISAHSTRGTDTHGYHLMKREEFKGEVHA